MEPLLESLRAGEPLTSDDLLVIAEGLVERLRDVLGAVVCRPSSEDIDKTGAFPSISLEVRSDGVCGPFGFAWSGLLSFNGYDDDDGRWILHGSAHVFPFIDARRVTANAGSVLLLRFQERKGRWEWVEEGWVVDEFEEFSHIEAPF